LFTSCEMVYMAQIRKTLKMCTVGVPPGTGLDNTDLIKEYQQWGTRMINIKKKKQTNKKTLQHFLSFTLFSGCIIPPE